MNDYQQHFTDSFAEQFAELPAEKTRISGQQFDADSAITSWRDHHFSDCRFSALELTDVQWSGLIFQHCEFSTLHFKNADLSDCRFIDCRLTDCRFDDTRCSSWLSQQTHWLQCEFQHVQSQNMTFQEGEWHSLSLFDCDSAHWNVLKLNVTQLHIRGGHASDWNLCQSSLSQCHWCETTLTRQVAGECQLNAIRLKNLHGLAPIWFDCRWQQSELTSLKLTGGSFHRNHFTHCDFSTSHLIGTVMCEAILEECQLNATCCERIQGQKIHLRACSLDNSHWPHAHLQQAVFSDCLGQSVGFPHADLRGAQLSGLPAAANFAQARLHSNEAFSHTTEHQAEPLLDAIATWYANIQPGPQHLRSELMTTGASRYV